jgi:magnesium chelatase accessory protein
MSRMDWARDGGDWPNRAASRFVTAGGLRWHVQRMGAGAPMLLLHGTGAATHSWSALLPLLARDHDVIAIDLPGHGFTTSRASGFVSLPWMARVTGELLTALDVAPVHVVAHSAGAAVAARMILDGRIAPAALVALSGAMLPFPGMARQLFPAIAKALFLNPFVPRLLSWHASSGSGAVERTIRGTGSTIDARQMALYARLFASHAHVEAALGMMANWDLPGLEADLPRLQTPLTLVAPENDKFVGPDVAERIAARVPTAHVVRVPGLGHLAHEEDAPLIAGIIAEALSPASRDAI